VLIFKFKELDLLLYFLFPFSFSFTIYSDAIYFFRLAYFFFTYSFYPTFALLPPDLDLERLGGGTTLSRLYLARLSAFFLFFLCIPSAMKKLGSNKGVLISYSSKGV